MMFTIVNFLEIKCCFERLSSFFTTHNSSRWGQHKVSFLSDK